MDGPVTLPGRAAQIALWVLLLAAILTRPAQAESSPDLAPPKSPAGPAQAESAIAFRDDFTENAFPESLSFHITAASSAGQIRSATLFYRFRDSTNWTRQIVEVEPAGEVALSYVWETGNVTVVPSSPIYYYWEVTDTAGNRQRSEESPLRYDDIRFEWQILEDEYIAVWWHDRAPAFGQRVFAIAQRAFTEQRRLFGVAPEYQIRIIIYNDFDEFAEWHSYVSEFVGGQAFPPFGITTQIVEAYASEEYWLNGVIPHEISHLYLYQASHHPLNSVPAWLNEGLAQYNEFSFNSAGVLLSTKEKILNGELLPLWSLSGSFGYDEEEVRFAYNESYSAVTYLIEAYGEEGLSRLLAAYRQGMSDDKAFLQAFDQTLDEFERDWLTWQGVPQEMYPTRTPRPTIAWPATTPMAVPPTHIPTVTPEPTPTDRPSPTDAVAVAEKETEEPAPEPSAGPTAVAAQDETETGSGGLPCLSGLLPAALLAFMAFRPFGRALTQDRRMKVLLARFVRQEDRGTDGES